MDLKKIEGPHLCCLIYGHWKEVAIHMLNQLNENVYQVISNKWI